MDHISNNAIHQIRGFYSSLRQSEKKVADYILQNIDTVINSSISEVANESNISDATVIRFCKAVGFFGFQDLKISLAKNTTKSGSPKIFENISKTDDLKTAIEKIFANNIFSINETMQIINIEDLKIIAGRLKNARQLYLYGVGTSVHVAEYTSYRFTRMGLLNKAYVSEHSIALSTATVKDNDVILLISQSGSTREIVEAAKLVKKKGAFVITVTGYPHSPVAKISDIVIQNAVHEAPFESGGMPSLLAQLSTMDAITVAVAMRDFDETIRMIRETAEALKTKKY